MDVDGLPLVQHDETDILSTAPVPGAPPCSPNAASATRDWVRGANVPAVSRAHGSTGSDGLLTAAVKQVIGNLHHLASSVSRRFALEQIGKLRRDKLEVSAILAELLGVERDAHCSLTDSVVVALAGLHSRTVANTMHKIKVAEGDTSTPRGLRGRPPKTKPSDGCCAEGTQVGVDEIPEGLSELLQLPNAGVSAVSADGSSPISIAQGATPVMSFPIPASLCSQDPNRRAGLRVASLAARFFTSPSLPLKVFTPLLAWLSQHFPGEMGSTNHSLHFVRDFGRTMGAHLQTCQALAHWQLLPALRIPSDFQRIVDGYTCMGEPLLVLAHVLVKPDGSLGRMVVDLSPNAADALRTERGGQVNAAAGSAGRAPASGHRWKSGAAVAEHIVLLESGLSMSLRDMLLRHAVTVGDGGYVGAHSVSLMQHLSHLLLREVGPSLPMGVQETCTGGTSLGRPLANFMPRNWLREKLTTRSRPRKSSTICCGGCARDSLSDRAELSLEVSRRSWASNGKRPWRRGLTGSKPPHIQRIAGGASPQPFPSWSRPSRSNWRRATCLPRGHKTKQKTKAKRTK